MNAHTGQFNKKLDMKSVIKILLENKDKSESKDSEEILECEDQMSAEEYKQRIDNIFAKQLARLSVFKTIRDIKITDTINLEEYKQKIQKYATDMLYNGHVIMSKKMREYVNAHRPTSKVDGNRAICMWELEDIQSYLNGAAATQMRMHLHLQPEEIQKRMQLGVNGQQGNNAFVEKNNTQISDQVDDNINVKSVIEALLDDEEDSKTEDSNEVVEDEDKMSVEEYEQRLEAIYTDYANKLKGWRPIMLTIRGHAAANKGYVLRRIYEEGVMHIFNDKVKKYILARRPAPFAGGNRTICMLELANIERYLDLEYRERAGQVFPIKKGRASSAL